ncbi:PPC domain-containing protein [Armatimonas sp.]|uniref:PPC domain-containing protein n=1 Tax=Armatimonas sp. TaxID=1872638 RepID=UPI00286ACC75|nr:PPC domain-containing protein [Armatimonas sp.]
MQNKPTLKEIAVFGLVAGQTTKLTLTGENLAPSGVTVKGPLQAKLLDSKSTTATVEVIVPADCPPESFELTLVHPKDSPTIKLPVLPAVVQEVTVKKPLSRFDQAFPLAPSPSLSVQTNLESDQVHLYQLALKRGEKIEITVTGARSPLSDLDPLLRLRDSQRRMLTLSAGRLKVDRRLSFTAPSDGTYFLEVGDSQQRNTPKMLYRLVVRRL